VDVESSTIRLILARSHRPPFAADVAAADVSEAAGFAAWPHMDMHDVGTARAYYRMTVERARDAGDGLLAARDHDLPVRVSCPDGASRDEPSGP
jgi:hypothetical protein